MNTSWEYKILICRELLPEHRGSISPRNQRRIWLRNRLLNKNKIVSLKKERKNDEEHDTGNRWGRTKQGGRARSRGAYASLRTGSPLRGGNRGGYAAAKTKGQRARKIQNPPACSLVPRFVCAVGGGTSTEGERCLRRPCRGPEVVEWVGDAAGMRGANSQVPIHRAPALPPGNYPRAGWRIFASLMVPRRGENRPETRQEAPGGPFPSARG